MCTKVAREEQHGAGRGKTISTGKNGEWLPLPHAMLQSMGGEEGQSIRMSDTSGIFQLSMGQVGEDTQKWKMLRC